MKEPVEVMKLDGIEVNQCDVCDAGSRESFGDNTSDASSADNADMDSGKVCLFGVTPRRDSPAQSVRGGRWRKQPVIKRDAELRSCNTHC
jgi:hypothetical protein